MRNKIFIFVPMAIMVLLSCSGERGLINVVKNGTLYIDNTVTVGNAFDNYQYFNNTEWRTFETEQKRKIVEVIGSYDLAKAREGYLKQPFASENEEFKQLFELNKSTTRGAILHQNILNK